MDNIYLVNFIYFKNTTYMQSLKQLSTLIYMSDKRIVILKGESLDRK
jgi:hypothetical protein